MSERITKYDHLYKMMVEGRDPEKMMIFGKAERRSSLNSAKKQ